MEKAVIQAAKLKLFLLIGIFVSSPIFAQISSQRNPAEMNAYLDIYFKHKKTYIDDIQVHEINVKRPKETRVTDVESIGELPLQIAVLLDASGSHSRVADEIRQFYAEMIELLPLRSTDSVSLIAVNNKIQIIQDPTFDKVLLLNGFDKVRFIANTRLSDAIYWVSNTFGDQKNSRKALLMLSDGGDNGSTRTMQEAYQTAIANNVRVYMLVKKREDFVVTRNDGSGWQTGGGDHKKHVEKTGGRVFTFSNLESAKEEFTEIINEWNHLKRVRLSIHPPEERMPDVKISVSRKGVKAFYPSALQYIAAKPRNNDLN